MKNIIEYSKGSWTASTVEELLFSLAIIIVLLCRISGLTVLMWIFIAKAGVDLSHALITAVLRRLYA